MTIIIFGGAYVYMQRPEPTTSTQPLMEEDVPPPVRAEDLHLALYKDDRQPQVGTCLHPLLMVQQCAPQIVNSYAYAQIDMHIQSDIMIRCSSARL